MEENRMEGEKGMHDGECCGRCWSCMHRRGCCHGHGWGWWRVIKIIFLLVIFALIFGAGMLTGAIKVIRSGGWGSMGAIHLSDQSGWGMMTGDRLPVGMWNMMGAGDESRRTTRMMGTITGVTENKISISDNGAQTHTIVSGSNTLIVISGQLVGLAALKPGQTIVAAGTLDAAGELQAQTIQGTL